MPQNYRNKINIKKCYTTGKIEHAFSGGFIHYFVGKESEINIEDSYTTGDIGNQAGGFFGFGCFENGKVSIKNCYTTGDIGNEAGGFFAHYNCFNAKEVLIPFAKGKYLTLEEI